MSHRPGEHDKVLRRTVINTIATKDIMQVVDVVSEAPLCLSGVRKEIHGTLGCTSEPYGKLLPVKTKPNSASRSIDQFGQSNPEVEKPLSNQETTYYRHQSDRTSTPATNSVGLPGSGAHSLIFFSPANSNSR